MHIDFPTGDISAQIDDYMRIVLRKAMQDLMTDGKYVAVKKELENPLTNQIVVQHCYNTKTNKAYLEYNFSANFMGNYDIEKMSYYINERITNNFKYDTMIWPEIILVDDGVHERCDSSLILTPFAIGYWKSLSGVYEFLTDQAEVIQAANGLNITSAPDKKPDKKFEDFCNIVKAIDEKYRQTILSEEDKLKYIQEYQDIYIKYHTDTETFNTKLAALKTKYNLKTKINSKIPDMFDEYEEKFEDFFGTDLPDLDPYIVKSYFTIDREK